MRSSTRPTSSLISSFHTTPQLRSRAAVAGITSSRGRTTAHTASTNTSTATATMAPHQVRLTLNLNRRSAPSGAVLSRPTALFLLTPEPTRGSGPRFSWRRRGRGQAAVVLGEGARVRAQRTVLNACSGCTRPLVVPRRLAAALRARAHAQGLEAGPAPRPGPARPSRSGSRTDGRAAIDRTDRLHAAAAQRSGRSDRCSVGIVAPPITPSG